LSLQWRDPAAHTYKKTLLHSALKLRQEIGERAEAIRLLYVAMTRAMDTLHLIGTMKDPRKWEELYGTDEASPFVDTDIRGASNYLQLILPTALKRRDLFDVEVVDASDTSITSAAYDTIPSPPSLHFRQEVLLTENQVSANGSARKGSHEAETGKDTFVYPSAAAARLKSKYSVTGLSSAGREAPVFFMAGGKGETEEDAGLSAAQRGTALHRALELMDFREAYAHRGDLSWFDAFLTGLKESGALSEDEAKATGTDALVRFADSEFLARVAAAEFLIKEAPFNMKLPLQSKAGIWCHSLAREGWAASQHVGESVSDTELQLLDEEIVVQGVIDCLFEEEDGLVIADYKSGWFDVSAYESEADRIRAAYGTQVRLYSRAAELIFGKPVKKGMVYMTRAGVTIDIPKAE
jgi:ATP-dependent helicase/nuclease subunit A